MKGYINLMSNSDIYHKVACRLTDHKVRVWCGPVAPERKIKGIIPKGMRLCIRCMELVQ